MPKHTRTITVSWPEAVALVREALFIPDHAGEKIDGLDMPDLSFTWDEDTDGICRVCKCKVNTDGSPMGYVCTRDDCPTTPRVR